jgi:hypothetical protein
MQKTHFFLGGRVDLCRLRLANDDKYYHYMFHIINAIRTMSIFFHDDSDETNSRLDFILSSHGLVSTKGYSLADMACFFFRHILNGMCAYSNGVSCQMIVPLSSADVSFRTFAVVNAGCCTIDMSSVLCESLGYSLDFEHQSTTLQEVLSEYRTKSRTMILMKSHDFYFHVLSLISYSEIILLSAIHGISLVGGKECLRQSLLHHLCYGGCFSHQNSDLNLPDGCKTVILEYLNDFDILRSHGFQTTFLYKGAQILSRTQLISLLNYYNISYDSQWTLRHMREHLSLMIENVQSDDNEMDDDVLDFQERRTRIIQDWPHELTDENKRNLVHAFKHQTSSAVLQKKTCACCAEDVFQSQCEVVPKYRSQSIPITHQRSSVRI